MVPGVLMTTQCEKKVGEIVRVEWDVESGTVRVIMEIIDPIFKSRVLHSKDLLDLIVIKGKDAMVIATKEDQ